MLRQGVTNICISRVAQQGKYSIESAIFPVPIPESYRTSRRRNMSTIEKGSPNYILAFCQNPPNTHRQHQREFGIINMEGASDEHNIGRLQYHGGRYLYHTA